MNKKTFILYQIGLFFVLLLVNVLADPYIGHPFSFVDLVAICIVFAIFILVGSFIGRLYRVLQAKISTKIILSITAFLLAVCLLMLIEIIWYNLTDSVLFG
ncbi:hypothetical protein [Metabacillus malikii]|uniref:Membrane protein n=1 Tax=Metabacillus malikii TaxID=1504265 RepID=A0ABT9ZHB8_9BACI|nr:hypothetical protein [Metabacillus malikii]MDQ0231375.1 putative membrane protein [Metabacillus malikii]